MKLLPILLFISLSTNAQNKYKPIFDFKIKEHKVSLAFTMLQGLSDGLRDASIFGRMRDKGQWWNGVDSWKNKYENNDPLQGAKFFGSTNMFVFTTDAPHAANMISNLSGEMAKVYMPNMAGSTFWQKLKTVVVYSTIRSAGHNLIYGVLFKPK